MPEVQFFASNKTDQVVLRAAMVQFSTHGYQRTSMDAIAKQAMVSRPTLYSYFKNKQAILRAVSAGIHHTTLHNIEVAFNAEAPLAERLRHAFAAWSAPFQDILFGSPHGAELVGASSVLAADISADARDKFQRLLVRTLKTAVHNAEIDLSRSDLTLKRAAEFLILALNGLSSGDADAAIYQQRLQTLVTVFLAATAAPTAK